MKILVLANAIAFSALLQPAFAQAPMPASEFAMKASVGNTFEVEESKLALKQSQSPKVKAFAKMMIADHSKAEKKLMVAAKASGSMVEMKLDDPHQAMVTALQGKMGADFDKAYVTDQVQAHQETATLLETYQSGGDDMKLKGWAKMTLPAVKIHLKKVEAMSSM